MPLPTLRPPPRHGQVVGGTFETPTGRLQGESPYGYRPPQESMNALQALSLGTMTIPGVSDALGLAGDLQMYAQQPESRGMLNYALTGAGMLPFVPGMAGATRFYHGTGGKNYGTAFDPNISKRTYYSKGTHFSASPKVGSEYAMQHASQQRVIPVDIDVENLKLASPEVHDKVFDEVRKMMRDQERWDLDVGEMVQNRLRGKGYVGVRYKHGGEDAVSLFEPQVHAKSIFEPPTLKGKK